MIGTHQLATEAVQSNLGLLWDCCCCAKDGGGKSGTGRPGYEPSPEGPLVPVFIPTVEILSEEPQITLPQTSLEKRDILTKLKDISDRHRPSRSVQVVGSPDKAPTVAGLDARLAIAFRKFLYSEEQEFLTLLLAALEDDCCEC